jgi:SAM-dependent methyltransferase
MAGRVVPVDGGDPGRWSDVAAGWAELWTGFAEPAWAAVAQETGIGRGTRVVDVGCGSGDFLAWAGGRGAVVAGIDPAPGMLAIARDRLFGDLRLGSADELPWPAGSFDVATSFNALQFAADTLEALGECARVVEAGGFVAVANWAEAALNDLHVIEAAVAAADGEEPWPDGELRFAGGLEALFAEAGLTAVRAGVAELPWEVRDGDALVRGVLLGEDDAVVASTAPVVLDAAQRFRTPAGGYRLVNAFRYAVGRVP